MFAELNASGYDHKSIFYSAEFEGILSKIIACYHLILKSDTILPNNENSIRDHILYTYLKKHWFKNEHQLTDYLFDPELPEKTGRIDIRVIPVNPLINDDAYFIIECKRLNARNQMGSSGLNSEYISEGVCRYISKKYTSYFGVSGMIAFVVESIDINKNITVINDLLMNSFKESNTRQELKYYQIVSDFHYSYCSIHSIEQNNVIIYHLMLDFSKNIK